MMERIAIAIGDPNGIGPEIAVKAAAALTGNGLQPILVGDEFVIREYARRHAPQAVLTWFAEAPDKVEQNCLYYEPVVALDTESFCPGKVDPAAGRATVAYVRAAVQLAQDGIVRAVIGCPHSETAINGAGIPFSGYPGLIAQCTGTPADKVFLMLAAAGLRIAHVTLHESVAHALGRITTELVVSAGVAAVEATRRLGVENPRLGVFGINPHAG